MPDRSPQPIRKSSGAPSFALVAKGGTHTVNPAHTRALPTLHKIVILSAVEGPAFCTCLCLSFCLSSRRDLLLHLPLQCPPTPYRTGGPSRRVPHTSILMYGHRANARPLSSTHPQKLGCPILRPLGEGWDAYSYHPPQICHPERSRRTCILHLSLSVLLFVNPAGICCCICPCSARPSHTAPGDPSRHQIYFSRFYSAKSKSSPQTI
jgi:hypothetical protein